MLKMLLLFLLFIFIYIIYIIYIERKKDKEKTDIFKELFPSSEFVKDECNCCLKYKLVNKSFTCNDCKQIIWMKICVSCFYKNRDELAKHNFLCKCTFEYT